MKNNETKTRNFFTDEEYIKVIERMLIPYPEEVLLAKCNHRDKNGFVNLENNADKRVHECKICGTKFRIDYSYKEVDTIVSSLVNILEIIKMDYRDIPEATNLRIAELIPSIKKIPKLYSMTMSNKCYHRDLIDEE